MLKRVLVDDKKDMVIDKRVLVKARQNFPYYKLSIKKGRLGRGNKIGTKRWYKMSQTDLSRKLGRSKKQIERYENMECTTLPPPDAIKKICLIFQIDANELFGMKWITVRDD